MKDFLSILSLLVAFCLKCMWQVDIQNVILKRTYLFYI